VVGHHIKGPGVVKIVVHMFFEGGAHLHGRVSLGPPRDPDLTLFPGFRNGFVFDIREVDYSFDDEASVFQVFF
jgi:hypothetical protein